MKSPTLPAFAVLLLMHGVSHGHHSASIYDREAPISIEGTIVRYEWRNPHVYLYVEEATGGAEPVTWEVEGGPPAILKRLGWTEDVLKVGDHVTVTGIAGRNQDKKIALMETLAKAGATVLSMQQETLVASLTQGDAAVAERATGLAGTWVTLLDLEVTAPFLMPKAGFAVTEKGQAALDSFVETEESPAIECIPLTAPLLMLTPDIKSIEAEADVVRIRAEFDATERTVHLNVASHDGAPESIHGHSIGRFEGGALVIDTARFAPHRSGIAGGLPSGAQKRLSERLELNEEGTRLTYVFTLEDPEHLAMPLTGQVQWAYRPDLEYTGLPCDIANARRFTE